MAYGELRKIMEQVEALTPDDWRKLRALLDGLLAERPLRAKEDEFEQKLIDLGLLSEVKPPIRDLTPYQSRKPVEVKGKPPSEVIIEERR